MQSRYGSGNHRTQCVCSKRKSFQELNSKVVKVDERLYSRHVVLDLSRITKQKYIACEYSVFEERLVKTYGPRFIHARTTKQNYMHAYYSILYLTSVYSQDIWS